MLHLSRLCVFVGVLTLASGEGLYATTERIQLSIPEHLNAVRLQLEAACFENSNCSTPTQKNFFSTILGALSNHATGANAPETIAVKVILQGLPLVNPGDTRLVMKIKDDQVRMDCVFLQNDEVIPGDSVASQLNKRMGDINEILMDSASDAPQPIKLTLVRKLNFPETLSWAEYVGLTIVGVVLLAILLIAGPKSAAEAFKKITQLIQKKQTSWEQVELRQMRVFPTTEQPTEEIADTSTPETTTITITDAEIQRGSMILTIQKDDTLAHTRLPLRLSSFSPVIERDFDD